MKRTLWMLLALGLGASCAGDRSGKAQEVGVPTGSRFASAALCEQAVDSLERSERESTTTPVGQKGYFHTAEYDQRHRDRVRRCSITLSEKEAQCIADAPSLQYVRDCRRFALVR